MKKIILVLICFISFEAYGQNKPDTTKKKLVDTVKKDILTAPDTVKKLHSKAITLVIPTAAIAYGVSSFVIHPIRRIDYYIHGDIQRTNPTFSSRAESYFLITPIVMVYGLDLIGVEGKNRFIDRTALLGLSARVFWASASELLPNTQPIACGPMELIIYLSRRGIQATAFMGAEFLAQEYSEKSPIYTVIGYGAAVTTGIFRMYNRDHWFSDVVAGAGFGVLSTKLAYLVYPYIRNKLTHKDSKGRSTMIMPTYQNGAPGLSFAMQL